MKREIKFRGKVSKTKLWVYGDLLHVGNGCIITTNSELGETLPDGDIGLAYNRNEFAVVVPETVGQFTGLLDKNGKEIYEGDIIRSYDSNGETITHYIEWKERDAVYRATNIKYPLLGGWAYQDWIDECEKEIIGNVFDNPELLKTETL